ncbi:class I SAM-dependent methyltransferase [Paralimibaculum aggregatum]|uniref:Class I SAM-dependent methyltransferase n=1 Tax=Paralimibaculum aggregatum TaxID=3036245 RepID=A0ABQ6LEK8_9RHOB|nr:class I SAM-dependent methyltransferase [Limibaculum sp. NKW23]GMG81766.1 class I SAM-dependent methyltransferase [Limibaculum sp. NKW23]
MAGGPAAAEVEAGQAVYTPLTLALYDRLVLGLSNRLLWRCPTRHLRALYAGNLGARHLDIGVGTGYFLDTADWPVPAPRITLLDLNPHSLAAAGRRIARHRPEAVRADCLEPLPVPVPPGFDSVGLCYLLHCLPGAIPEKARVLDHAAAVLAPGGCVFGATILQGDAPRSRAAQALMDLYNARGIFSNARDRHEDLEAALDARFAELRLWRQGAVALFAARRPR